MEWVIGLLGTEYVRNVLGPELVKYILLGSIVGVTGWKILRVLGQFLVSVANHFMEMRDEVKKLRLEVHSLADVFRDQNHKSEKRFGNLEATQEALKYETFELKQDMKQLHDKVDAISDKIDSQIKG